MSAIRVALKTMVLDEGAALALFSREWQARLRTGLAVILGSALLAGCSRLIGRIVLARHALRYQRAEKGLQTSESRFKTLCDQAPLGIYEADAEGNCTYTNRSWSATSGLSASESLGHGWAKVLHPDDRERVFQGWKTEAQRGKTWEYRLINARGETRWMRAVGGPIYSAQGALTGYVGTVEDVTEYKQAGERFRLVFEAAPGGMVMVNNTGQIVLANSRIEQLFGYEHQEVVGQPIEILLPESSREAHVGLRGELFAQPVSRPMEGRELNARRKDGTQFPVEIGLNSVATEEGICVLASIVDITERRRAEDALGQALQQLQVITDNMPAGVMRYSQDLRYLWVSRSYAAWFGLAPEAIAGRPIFDVVGPETCESILPHMQKALSGEREEYEAQVSYPGVGVRWIHAVCVPTRGQDNKIDGAIGVVEDVTERHEAEERLRDSEERFRAIFLQAAVGMAQTDVDGRWLLLNDRLCEILGYSREELREKTFIDIAHPDDREEVLTAHCQLLADEIPSWSSEMRYIRKDGVTVWVRNYLSVMHDQNYQPRYFVCVVEDITQKVRAEHALRQSRRELRALAGRLINAEEEERKRISRELHDDLSQKLALLAFDTDSLILTPTASLDEMKESLRGLKSRVVQLLQDVRQISHQLHPSILEDLGLKAALTELCEEFSARHGIEVMFEQEAVPTALPVEIASCLYRVAQEALHNVLKHAQASQVLLRVSGSPEGIHLYIHDTGVGFDSEASTPRLGLGIVSMKERVRMVDGKFSIHSQPGQGTEVNVFVLLKKTL